MKLITLFIFSILTNNLFCQTHLVSIKLSEFNFEHNKKSQVDPFDSFLTYQKSNKLSVLNYEIEYNKIYENGKYIGISASYISSPSKGYSERAGQNNTKSINNSNSKSNAVYFEAHYGLTSHFNKTIFYASFGIPISYYLKNNYNSLSKVLDSNSVELNSQIGFANNPNFFITGINLNLHVQQPLYKKINFNLGTRTGVSATYYNQTLNTTITNFVKGVEVSSQNSSTKNSQLNLYYFFQPFVGLSYSF